MSLSVRPPLTWPVSPPSRTRTAAAPSRGRRACGRSRRSPPGPTGCPPCRRPTSSSARPTGTSRGGGRASPAGPPEARQEALGPRAHSVRHAELAAHGLPRGRRVVARHASAGSTRAWPRRPSVETDVPSPTAPRAEAVCLVGRPAPVRDLAELVAEVAPRRPRTPRGPICRARERRRTRCVPPHLGHASGSPPALPSPSGTCARSSPVSLLFSPMPSLLASRDIMPSIPTSPFDALFTDNIVAGTRGIVMSTMV